MAGKWFWMMNYCKENSMPPAQQWAWNRAEIAYTKGGSRSHDCDKEKAVCRRYEAMQGQDERQAETSRI